MNPIAPVGPPKDHFRDSLHRWFNEVNSYGMWGGVQRDGGPAMILVRWMTYP